MTTFYKYSNNFITNALILIDRGIGKQPSFYELKKNPYFDVNDYD